MILDYLLDVSFALLHNENVNIESNVSKSRMKMKNCFLLFDQLDLLLPAILSCLLEENNSIEHWSRRDLAAKCVSRIVQSEFDKKNRFHFDFQFRFSSLENTTRQQIDCSNEQFVYCIEF